MKVAQTKNGFVLWLCLATLLLCTQVGYGQEVPVFQWARQTVSGPGDDYGNAVTTDAAGNVFSTGEFTEAADFDSGLGVFTLTPSGNTRDIFVSKLDQNGNFLWAVGLGAGSLDAGTSITTDAAGNVYVTGYYGGNVDFDPGPGTFLMNSGGSSSNFILKLDTDGNFVWAKSIDTGFNAAYMTSHASGFIYITGYFEGTADFDPGPAIAFITIPNSLGNGDAFVLKLDLDGNYVWARNLGDPSGPSVGRDISVGTSGEVITTGTFRSTADFDPGAGTATLTSAGNTDVFISKLDASGDYVWAKRVGGTSADAGKAARVDASGNVTISGSFVGTVDFDPGTGVFSQASAGNIDIFVVKLNATGDFLWATRTGGSQADENYAMAIDNVGAVYTTGYFRGTVDFDPGAGTSNLTSTGNQEIFIQKLDASGNYVWATRTGSGSSDIAYAIHADASGNIYLNSFFYGTADFDPTCGVANLTSSGSQDVFIQKLSVGFVPVVSTFAPPSGPAGTPVFITGSNFSPILTNNVVRFNGVLTGVSDATPTGITTVVPAGATTGPISVRIGCYTGTSATDFVVMSPPTTITGFSPQNGPIGTTVTITGTNFSTSPTSNFVYFGATRATVIFSTTTQITAVVPPGATYQPITVTKGGSTAFSARPFLVTFTGGGNLTSCAFSAKTDFTTGGGAYTVAMGDLDGDGKTDLVVANQADDNVSILRNTSTTGTLDGASFAPAVNLAANNESYGVAIGDLDGDGKQDIVVSNYVDNNISVYRNVSTPGTLTAASFAAKVDFTTDIGPYVVRIGDLDVDGKSDIAVTNYGGGFSISLFRNTSTPGTITAGSFAPKVDIPSFDNYPYGLAIGDLDADGKPEMAVTNYISSSVSLYRNISTPGAITTGSFAPQVAYAVQVSPLSVAIGDLDADGKPEVSVANYTSNSVTVLKNATTSGAFTAGSFAGGVHFTTDQSPENMVIDDLNGDGKPDLATGNQFGPSVSILQNTTTAAISFSSFLEFPALFNTRIVAIGDLDGDGKPDLAVASAGGGAVSVLRNTAAALPTITGFAPTSGIAGTSVTIVGTNFSNLPTENTVYFGATKATVTSVTTTQLTVTVPPGATYEPISVLVGCLTAYSDKPFVVTFTGTGVIDATTFGTKEDFASGSTPADIAFGDLDGDGKPDVTTINDGGGTVSIFRNASVLGNVSFAAGTTTAAGGSPQSMEIGDIDGDGKLDLVTVSDGSTQVSVHRNTSTTGTISFAARTSFTTGTLPVNVAIGEIDGDGRADIAVVNRTSGTVSVFRNTSSPGIVSFAAKIDFPVGAAPNGVAIGDIDGDGKLEVLTANRTASTVSIFRNISSIGSIAFDTRLDLSSGGGANGVSIGDLDVDGKPDVAVANYTTRTVSVFRNISTPGSITAGSFSPVVNFTNSATNNPTYVSIGDVNGDDKPDMLVGNDNGTLIQIHRNTSAPGSITAGSFAARVDYTTGTRPANVNMVDLDGDGKPEIAASNASSANFSVLQNISSSCIPSSERAALVALYNATDGANWTDDSGWLTDPDEDNWNGVLVSGCHVVEVELQNNNLVGVLPPEIGALTSLTKLDLFNNLINDVIPPEIGNMTALTHLTLTANQMYGTMPPEIGNLINLQSLQLGSNQFYGELPPEIWNLGSLTSLHLYSNQLDGILPPEIGNLTNLTSLRLGGNFFYGNIPPEIGNLSLLTNLQLDYNYFDGEIPPEMGNLSLLKELLLNDNQLFGAIPFELGNLPVCDNLALQRNFFTDLPDLSSSPLYILNQTFASIDVSENHLTFEDLEPNTVFPLITLGPQAKVPPGGTVGFVTPGPLFIPFATPGTGNLYQWYKDGSPVAGQTLENLNIASTTGGDVGFYYVRITSSVVPGVTLESRPYTVYTDVCSPVVRTAGDLDTTFDPLSEFSSSFNSPAIQSDGKIIVHTYYSIVNSIVVDGLIRFNTDGSQDVTFQSNSHGPTFIIQPNDKIITATGNGGLIRLEADGTEDPSFANPNYYNAFISALALQADGKVIVAFNEDGSPHVRRLNTDGTEDLAFVAPDLPDVIVVRVQSDGYILLGGQFPGGIARLDPTGAYDPGFSATSSDFVTDIAVQTDGKIVVVGPFSYFNDLPQRGLVRLHPDGSIDYSFDAVGVTDLIESTSYPNKIAIQPDGKIILGGFFGSVNGTNRKNLVRLNTDGTIDCYFDPEESTETSSDVEGAQITGMALQADGKIIISGAFEEYDEVARFGLARVNNILGIFPPTVTNFVPASGPVGAAVTINGTNFNTTPGGNIVFFGATQAVVTAATATQLTVTAPTGATHHPITVSVGGLSAHAPRPFILTFSGGGNIDNCSFAPAYTVGTTSGLTRSALADIDGDGKTDLIIPNSAADLFSIFQNTSTPGILDASSFAAPITFGAGETPFGIAVGDLDGDGKRDIAVINYLLQKLSIFKNQSTGTISLAPKVDITIPDFAHDVSIGDIDGDGKLDLIITSSLVGLTVYRNIGTPGVINTSTFAAGVNFATGPNPNPFVLGDIDGDGKLDAAVPSANTYTVSLLRNTSIPGTVSYAAQVVLTTAAGSPPAGGGAVYTALGDLDGDSKLDLVVANNTVNTTSIFRNSSTAGSLSFDPKFDLANTGSSNTPAVSDLDGDGKIELVRDAGNTVIEVFKNTSTPGAINAASFNAPIDFTRAASSHILLGDVDGDGRNDMITTSATIQAFHNLVGAITPPTISGFTPSSGTVSSSVTISGTNFLTPFSTSVNFNGTNAAIIDLQPTSIIVSVPAGATTGPIQVIVGCNTVNSSTNFSVCTPPAAPGTVPNNRCGSGTVILGATGTTDGNYRWYTVSSGGTAIAGEVNSSYTTPVITATTTYYVSIDNGICEGPRSAVTATILTPPADPTPFPGTRCGGGTVSLAATGGSPGLYRWYDGGVLIGGAINDTYITPIITVTTVYEVSIHDGICESNRMPITATINTIPILPVAPDVPRCDAGTVLLSASGAVGTEAYRWYDLPSGGTVLATTPTYTTGILTVTTPYYVSKIETATLCEGSRTMVQAIINTSPSPPSTTGNSGCSGTSISLSASGASPGEYRWYTASSGGTAIAGAVNDTFATPVLTTTASFHVAINDGTCESTRTPVTATVLSLPASPVPTPATGCGPSASLTLTASGGSPGEYRWYNTPTGGSPLVGETNSSYVTPSLTTSTTFYVSINNSICESPRISVLAEIRSCTPIIAAASATTPIGSSTTINIAALVTIISDPIDIASIKVIAQPLSGATATIVAGVLEINYSGVPFAGTDRLTIEACDLAGHCAQQEITIEVIGEITVYNALSPNGDGKNDVFYIQYINALPETQQNKVTILNRWGTVVFETTNYDNTSNVFNGLSDSGSELPSGTYYYTIEFTSGEAKRTGFISLRR